MLFELLHSDLCGPMKPSIGGAKYYIIYIDDCTRYTEVYFLITKTAEEVSAKFQHYQAWVETQGFHIKRFRSDNGSREYNNSIFLGLLGEKGITFEPSPAYTQHKNGTAEWIIQTLNAKAFFFFFFLFNQTRIQPIYIMAAYILHGFPVRSPRGGGSLQAPLFALRPGLSH